MYEQGGIYLDVDVELIKPLDELAARDGYMGFEKEMDGEMRIATGLGFGARAGHPIIGALLKDYEDISFVKEDGSLDMESCPGRNTRTLCKFGLRPDLRRSAFLNGKNRSQNIRFPFIIMMEAG